MELAQADPKGLIRESYRIEGITEGECRSIFLDWALSLAPGTEPQEAMHVVLAAHGADPAHPMSRVLAAGLAASLAAAGKRRGGRAARIEGP